jgi:hypothetical protein
LLTKEIVMDKQEYVDAAMKRIVDTAKDVDMWMHPFVATAILVELKTMWDCGERKATYSNMTKD